VGTVSFPSFFFLARRVEALSFSTSGLDSHPFLLPAAPKLPKESIGIGLFEFPAQALSLFFFSFLSTKGKERNLKKRESPSFFFSRLQEHLLNLFATVRLNNFGQSADHGSGVRSRRLPLLGEILVNRANSVSPCESDGMFVSSSISFFGLLVEACPVSSIRSFGGRLSPPSLRSSNT